MEEKESRIKRIWKNITSKRNSSTDQEETTEVKESDPFISDNITEAESSNIEDIVKEDNIAHVDIEEENIITESPKDEKEEIIVEDNKKEEIKEENPDKYDKGSESDSKNKIKSTRDRFRGNPDVKNSRESLRNNSGETNPLNLK
jgi:hypothetical protein